MTTLYWAWEYIRVFFGYMFIMFIWPSVVFGGFLKGRSKTFRFSFCVTTQVVLVNTAVLMLGLFHILNPWVIRILFYGTFFGAILKGIHVSEREKKALKYVLSGTYGPKLFLANTFARLGTAIKKCFKIFCDAMRDRWWEYGVLSVVLIYGMIYFTYGAFQDYSYGFGDMYPHSAWIYGLTNGQIFSAGVYPEGMHCFVYCLHELFGITIYSSMLFLAGVHILIFMLSAYVLMKEIFRWRYTPMLALTAFLTVDVVCINEIYSMSRLQWSLPQEFGFYTIFLCAAFLVRYCKSEKTILKERLNPFIIVRRKWKAYQRKKLPDVLKDLDEYKEREKETEPTYTKGYWDENLLVFMMALAASLIIHFYPTIMAFFLCLAFVPVLFNKIFHRKRFLPLVVAALMGVVIAVVPMMGALASGIQFQGSIGWAVNVINGTDGQSSTTTTTTQTADPSQGTGGAGTQGASGSQTSSEPEYVQQSIGGVTITVKQDKEEEKKTEEVVEEGPKEPFFTRMKNKITKTADIIFRKSYVTLYKKDRATWIVGFTALAAALWLLCRVVLTGTKLILRAKKSERAEKVKSNCFDNYLALTFGSVFFMALYCASALGLPSLIAGSRLCSIAQLLILAMMMIPVDFLFTVLRFGISEPMLKVVSAFCVMGIYVGTMLTGTFHGFLYFELTRYNAAVMCTHYITESLPQNSYTIASTTDELYQLIQYGRHEELTNFINQSQREDYTIPTEYVFIYIEKKPLQYGQSHFFTGPEWLAWEKYPQHYNSYVSQCPEITRSEISEEIAKNSPKWFSNSSKSYSRLESRTQIESRMYEWIEEFQERYPYELHTYYEDDAFVCYYFRQNTAKLYDLAIMAE